MTRQLTRSSVVLTLTPALAALAALAATTAGGTLLIAQGFHARPGAWTFTVTMRGAMPMEGIPPEARALIEAQMSRPQTMNSCVTAEDLRQLRLGNNNDSNDETCKILSSTFTVTTADVTRECTGDEAYTETMHFEAPTPQTLTGSITRKAAEGTMTIKMAGKWTAARCKD